MSIAATYFSIKIFCYREVMSPSARRSRESFYDYEFSSDWFSEWYIPGSGLKQLCQHTKRRGSYFTASQIIFIFFREPRLSVGDHTVEASSRQSQFGTQKANPREWNDWNFGIPSSERKAVRHVVNYWKQQRKTSSFKN